MALQIDYQITADIENKRISYGDDKSSACDDCRIPIILQGEDSSRRLVVRFQQNNETVDISDCTSQVKCRINNRLIADRSCEITDNAVIVRLTADMTNQNGTLEVQITLCDINGAVLSSPILKLAVKESIRTGEVEQTEDFSVLQDLAKKIEPITADVKDARGGYALLGDRISALEAAGINALSFKGAKNCIKHSAGFTADSVGADSFYTTGLTLSAEDGCAVAEGTAGTPCSVYALFDEPITLARDSSRRVLAVMRMKAVQSDLRVYPLAGRYSGYYNYLCDSNIIESNITEHIGTNSYVQPLKKGEWLTIWALLGDTGKSFKLGGDETQLNGLGVYIPAQTDGTAPKLMIQSVCAYVSDSEERDLLNEVRNSVNANSGRLTIPRAGLMITHVFLRICKQSPTALTKLLLLCRKPLRTVMIRLPRLKLLLMICRGIFRSFPQAASTIKKRLRLCRLPLRRTEKDWLRRRMIYRIFRRVSAR